jgi:hypothetical protein
VPSATSSFSKELPILTLPILTTQKAYLDLLSTEAAHLLISFPSPCWRSSPPKRTPRTLGILQCQSRRFRACTLCPIACHACPLSHSVAAIAYHPDNTSTTIGSVVRRGPPFPKTGWENWLLMCLSNEVCTAWRDGWMIRTMHVELKRMRWSEWRSS